MHRIVIALGLCAGLVAAPRAQPWTGPLGTQMGITKSQLRGVIKTAPLNDSVLISETAPVPHPVFLDYAYRFANASGLCSVVALTPAIKASSFGDEIRGQFNELSEALVGRYGKPSNSFDFVRQGSLWTKPQDWMMALRAKERHLAMHWNAETLPRGLPNHLKGIALDALGATADSARIRLRYAFDNEAECESDRVKSRSKGL